MPPLPPRSDSREPQAQQEGPQRPSASSQTGTPRAEDGDLFTSVPCFPACIFPAMSTLGPMASVGCVCVRAALITGGAVH